MNSNSLIKKNNDKEVNEMIKSKLNESKNNYIRFLGLNGPIYGYNKQDNMMMAYCIRELVYDRMTDKWGGIWVCLDLNELRKMLPRKLRSSINLSSDSIFLNGMIVDVVKKGKDGEFFVNFIDTVNDYVMQRAANFTENYLKTLLTFKHVSSFRLFELLSTIFFDCQLKMKIEKFEIKFGLNELRFALGLAEFRGVDEIKIRNLFNADILPDFNHVIEYASYVKYKWDNNIILEFLDVAVPEINNLTNMHIRYRKKTNNKGKITSIVFKITIKPLASL